MSKNTARDMDPLKVLMSMKLEDRIKAVAEDLHLKSQRFFSIDANSLAHALGISDCKSPGRIGDWAFTRYAKIITVEEHAPMCSTTSEVVYLIQDQIEPKRFSELKTLSESLDDIDNPKFNFLSDEERHTLELAIAEKNLESNSSNGMNCFAHISVQTDGLENLEFEAILEDDGTSFILR